MILKRIGFYLTQKRSHAILVTSLCTFLSVFQLPMLPIAMIIVALVTLHNGIKEGFWITSWSLMILFVASFHLGFGQFVFAGLGKILVMWLLASLLSRSNFWLKTLYFATCVSVFFVLSFHLFMSDVSAWWFSQLMHFVEQFQPDILLMTANELKALIHQIAYFGTGIAVSAVMTINMFFLLLARAWQAHLFNPTGLKMEWRQLLLSPLYSGLVILVAAGAWFEIKLAMDIFPVLLLPLFFAGCALVYGVLPEKSKMRTPVLVTLYLGLLIFSPYFVTILIVVALTDSLFDFRKLRHKTIISNSAPTSNP